jgi:hypothetical protein
MGQRSGGDRADDIKRAAQNGIASVVLSKQMANQDLRGLKIGSTDFFRETV